MNAARVSVCLAMFKLMCNRSLNNEVIVLSAIVILIFPQNCDVCRISMTLKKLHEMWQVALQNIRCVSDLGPHMKFRRS